MRTAILLLSTVSLLAACSETADSTAPRSPATNAPVATAPNAQTSQVSTSAAGKPSNGPTITYLTSPTVNIDGIVFIANTAYITCPAGSVVVSGGYEFMSGFMNSRIRYNGPVGTNVWKVLVYGEGASQASFRAFGTCIAQ